MNRLLPALTVVTLTTLCLFALPGLRLADTPNGDWADYLGGPDRAHYSPLTQITPENVQKLQVAWTYSAPDEGQMQCNSLIVNGILYGVTASVQAFALDAATGRELWRFGDALKAWHSTSRGVAFWQNPAKTDQRILYTLGSNLYALNAQTGKPIPTFGTAGRVDLHAGLGPENGEKFIISNTPGTIAGNLIIMPVRVSEEAGAAPGHVRAFDVQTGKLVWTFRTIPHPAEAGYDTWPKDAYRNPNIGGVNCWAGMAYDARRQIVYVPTGSASFDFYGANRKGANLFANCLLALDARTGKRLWHFQFIHHDIWDRDLPAPPTLLTIRKNGQPIDVVAQTTKTGYVYVFDRVTGKPIFPIRETPVPASDMPGEVAWPTQPLPTLPAPFVRQTLTASQLNSFSIDSDSMRTLFNQVDHRPFAPFNQTSGTLLFPGCDGGAEWGGAAADPNGTLYVNANEMAWIFKLRATPKEDELAHLSPGQRVYTVSCQTCHGPERKGNPKSGYPSLVDISTRRNKAYVSQVVSGGKGMMPGFTQLTGEEKQALLSFLFDEEKKEVSAYPRRAKAGAKAPEQPYKITGYNRFVDSQGLPAIAPPWGTLTAIDLNTGQHRWQVPLGDVTSVSAKNGGTPTGTENYGGPAVTASGLLFIAATKDEQFRAFDTKTGRVLWQATLPAAGYATPSVYQAGGKQYVVIACGGGKLGTRRGNQYVAFTLP
ncbi:outer membrane protein assembly factor BamB family protein [Fibrella forsythiae]|uniref:PQQ-binding-like beta-propeller repeat protein n=1 Tax=Fibrella forsythiae TaxID=2817061 RepID=A0ABS3JGT8_9BACT|nr:PQQ-binding-like beta-propeller repeat protein [Fibrella forsythiae]MBO0949224.1 PQQ-binding-like beta-propeller repeat protein [Fibrella forsythiae]